MSDKERLEEVRFFLKKNKTEFSKILGYTTPQSYTNYLRGANKLSINMIKALKEYEPTLDINWIMYGQGEMFVGNSDSPSNNNSTDTKLLELEIQRLNDNIKHLEEKIEAKDDLIELFRETLKMISAKYDEEKKEAAEREQQEKEK